MPNNPHTDAFDPVRLTQDLVRCPSVTPHEGGALDVLSARLEALGFTCTRLPFSQDGTPDVDNLYARLGTAQPNFCFAGHTDVVPIGDETAWSVPPFEAAIEDGVLVGRGATDMKGAIAAFVAAVSRLVKDSTPKGSISFLITGDEEGPAINGTPKMLQWLEEQGEVIDHCLVGEPTNPTVLGEMIKIGRRGSVNAWLTVHGVQGHVAYPHLADNPLPRLAAMIERITREPLDDGTDHFQPSNLEITNIEVGNDATNVIPGAGRVRFNIRFNDSQTPEGLETRLRAQLDSVVQTHGGSYTLEMQVNGDAFVTQPGAFSAIVAEAVAQATGRTCELSTTGGTSDARFIKNYAPVIEFGLISQTMHKTDEQVAVSDLVQLTAIYEQVLRSYFAHDWGWT